MFQPAVKLEFVRRYCPPGEGWTVFVDIDPSEEGRTGGERKSGDASKQQTAMQSDAVRVRAEFQSLGVQVGGPRSLWARRKNVPLIDGDRDIVAFHHGRQVCAVVEVEGVSSGQPETKLYKAIGQIVVARSCLPPAAWQMVYLLVVYGKRMASHLDRARALSEIGVSALSLADKPAGDVWLFRAGQALELLVGGSRAAVAVAPIRDMEIGPASIDEYGELQVSIGGYQFRAGEKYTILEMGWAVYVPDEEVPDEWLRRYGETLPRDGERNELASRGGMLVTTYPVLVALSLRAWWHRNGRRIPTAPSVSVPTFDAAVREVQQREILNEFNRCHLGTVPGLQRWKKSSACAHVANRMHIA